MSPSIFGTDGVRGRAGQPPLTAEGALHLGAAFAATLPTDASRQVLIGSDTRRSGSMLAAALTAGLCAAGADVVDLGVVPTPLLSWYLAHRGGFAGGLVVTASHNPWPDNGVKFFGADGHKLSPAAQDAVEAALAHAAPLEGPPGTRSEHRDEAVRAWLRDLDAGRALSGRRILTDAASGAAWGLLAVALEAAGAEVEEISPAPDGSNINEGLGAVHPQALADRVRAAGAWAGVCLDGDGDRVILVDEVGTVHDGDTIVGSLAATWQRQGELRGGCVVGTVNSGGGLAAWLDGLGLELARSAVGDRHVHALMLERGANLGGESSGHILTPDLCPTGDATRVALLLLSGAASHGAPLSEQLGAVPRFPSRMRSVPAGQRPPLETLADLQAVLRAADAELGAEGGRYLLRYSGTEPILRILVEGPSFELVEAWSDRITDAAGAALG